MPRCTKLKRPSKRKFPPEQQGRLDSWLSSSSSIQDTAAPPSILDCHSAKKDHVLDGHVLEAQKIIQEAREKGEKEQNAAIIAAIEGIYTFPPWNGQREALHHLVFLRKDMILIAKTSFGKSMLLQAVSLILEKAITLIVLPLNQIGIEQTEYIRILVADPVSSMLIPLPQSFSKESRQLSIPMFCLVLNLQLGINFALWPAIHSSVDASVLLQLMRHIWLRIGAALSGQNMHECSSCAHCWERMFLGLHAQQR
jgi:hypothetical protein